MKVKKIISIFVIALFIMVLGTTNSQATLKLNNLDFNVQINEDGSMDVIETWNIYISETNTLYKTFNRDSSKYTGIENFSVKEITNGKNRNFVNTKTWKYHIEKNYYFGGINKDGQYEIAWGVGLDNSSDTRIYQIQYTVTDAIKKYGDCAELYWQFIGEDFEINADKITGTINLPNPVDDKKELKVWGHTEYLNGEIYVIDANTVEFNLDKYKAGYFVEIRILTPTYVFQNLEYTSTENKTDKIISEEEQWAAEANEKREKRDKNAQITMIAVTGCVALVGIFFITRISKKRKVLADNPKIKPDMELEYYRELPDKEATPLEAIFIFKKSFMQNSLSPVISATILDLILKEYISAEQDNKKITIKILNKSTDNLPKDEIQVLNLLKEASKDNILTMKELEKFIKKYPSKLISMQNSFDRISKAEAERKGKFSKEMASKVVAYIAGIVGNIYTIILTAMATLMGAAIPGEFAPSMIKYVLIAGGFTEVILIINLVLTSIIIKRFDGFTKKGVTERDEWKAFKKYMEDFSLLNEKEVPELVLWEKYLVFATAFGIADKVIKQLKIKYPELNNPDTLNNMILFHAISSHSGLNTNFISSINTSTSHMYSSTYSSGSGGGGGFSGGGGGGGRWRPAEADAKLYKFMYID